MKIVAGPASKTLGEEIAKLLGVEAINVFFKAFPDGESYLRLEGGVKGEKVVLVQTTSPPQDANIMQLALLADAAKRDGAVEVTAVVPYLAYARQDRVFLPGEPVSIEAIARMIKAAGVDSLITVNVHKEEALKSFPLKTKNLSAIPLLAEYFKRKGFEGAFSLAPDMGALGIAMEAARVLGGEYGFLEKHRDRYTGRVSVEKKKFEIKNKTVIIFDDIISTGGTVIAAAKILKELGAGRIHVACVHPLLVGDAERRILDAGVEEVVGTDSISSRVSKVSLAPLISGELKEH